MSSPLTLEQVSELVYDVFVASDIERDYHVYPVTTAAKLAIIRQTYIEHQHFPMLPVVLIARRIITGKVSPEEMAFWESHIPQWSK